MAEQPEVASRDAFGEWVVLELMGHRRLAGYLTEQELAGHGFLRLEIPGEVLYDAKGERHEKGRATQFYSPASVYAIHPVSEEAARLVAVRTRPEPLTSWELPLPRLEPSVDPDDVVDPDDLGGF